MDADLKNKQPCQCELCHPNWYLGRESDEFEPQPVAEKQEVALEELHYRKLHELALTC